MPKYDEKTESFIVRIWLEPRELRGAPPVWRGEIEHATSQVDQVGKPLHLVAESATVPDHPPDVRGALWLRLARGAVAGVRHASDPFQPLAREDSAKDHVVRRAAPVQ